MYTDCFRISPGKGAPGWRNEVLLWIPSKNSEEVKR